MPLEFKWFETKREQIAWFYAFCSLNFKLLYIFLISFASKIIIHFSIKSNRSANVFMLHLLFLQKKTFAIIFRITLYSCIGKSLIGLTYLE